MAISTVRATVLAAFMGTTLAATPVPALAQSGPLAPVIYVNNAAVTQYELDQRLRFMQVLRAPGASRDNALKALVEDRLKLQAARLIGIAVSDQGLEQGLSEFAGRANMDVDSFTQALAREGVERQAYRDFVRAGVAWREVVRQRVVPTIRVSDREIEQSLKREIDTPITTAVLLSELVIPAPPGQEQAALSRARQISETAGSSAAFAAAARRYSAVPSAARGGALDWTPLDNMAPSLREIVLSMRPGQTSQPLTVPGAVVLFHLRDTRGRLRAGAGDQTVEYVELALPSATEGAGILARADSCDQVYVEANRFAGDPIRRETLPLSAVPMDVAQRIASLDPNEGTVIDYGAGARLIMLCRRTPTLIDEPAGEFAQLPGVAMPMRRTDAVPGAAGQTGAAEAPNAQNAATDAAIAAGIAPVGDPPLRTRDEVREAIFNRKVNAAADAYLAELRADALIRQP